MGARLLARSDEQLLLHPADVSNVDEVKSKCSLLWYDLMTDDQHEIARLHKTLGLKLPGLRDAMGPEQLPKFEDYGDELFVVMHALAFADNRPDTLQINCFVTEGLFVTISKSSSSGLDWLWNAVQNDGYLTQATPDELLGELAEVIGHRFLRVIAELDGNIDSTYDQALSARPYVLTEIQALRKDETTIAKVLRPQRIMLNDLQRLKIATVTDEGRTLIGDAFDVHNLVVESLRSARSTLADALETYRGAAGDRQSVATVVLAVYSAILLPLTLLSGFMGMNVPLPGMKNNYSWIVITVVMAIIAFGSFAVFVKVGFIKLVQSPPPDGQRFTTTIKYDGSHRQDRMALRAVSDGDSHHSTRSDPAAKANDHRTSSSRSVPTDNESEYDGGTREPSGEHRQDSPSPADADKATRRTSHS